MHRFPFPVTVAFNTSGLLLVDSAIKGAALLVFASLVVLMLRRDSAATRHLVWMVAIVAMLFVPALSALLPQWRVLPEWAMLSTDRNTIETVVANGSDVIDGRYEAHEIDLPHPANYVPAPELPEPVFQSSYAIPLPPIVSDIRVAAKTETLATALWSVLPFVWVVGFLVLMIRLLAARLLLWQVERSASVIPHGERQGVSPPCLPATAINQSTAFDSVIAAFNAARLQLAVRGRITLLIHPDKTIPVVWGIIRHRLLLPVAAQQWSDEQLRSVLLHELAHIKRRDTLSQLLAQIACGLHWFNPLIWFATWRLHVERERACDDLVLASGVRASAYAEHLLNVATKLSSSPWTQACGLAMARNSSLHGRLAAVLSEKRNRRSTSTLLVCLSLLFGACISIPMAMLRAADETRAAGDPKPAESIPKSPTIAGTAINQTGMKIDRGMMQHLEWGNPVNGIRAAVMIRTSPQDNRQGEEPHVYMVLKNVSDKAIRFCDAESEDNPSKGKVDAEPVRNRKWDETANFRMLYWRQHDESHSSAMFSHGSTQTNVVLEPSDVAYIDFFDEPGNPDAKAGGLAVTERIIKCPSHALGLVLNIIHAPEGAWTGRLVAPPTRGAFAALGPMPKSKEGQALFQYWVDHARLNFEIPGGLIRRLHDKVLEFIRLNDGDQYGDPYAKKMQPLVARFEKTDDWNQTDVVALFDDIAVVTTIPLETTLVQIRENTLKRGQQLPVSLKDANWGEALPGGLRMAWILEPRAEKYHLGSALKSRVVIHNSGNEPVMFVARSFHQPEHKANRSSGGSIKVESTFWTTRGRPEPYRLHPGEYCEVHAPGIGIGPRNNDHEDWANIRPRSWILADEGEDIVFEPGDVLLTGDHNNKVDPDWWLKFITERISRDAPLPNDQKEREVILFRVISDLFGNSPTPEEAAEFLSDTSPEAIQHLATLLSGRTWHTSVAGPIKSGETKFHVLPEDPDAATRPRVAMNPGHYNLGDEIRFVVTRRLIGERIVNEADLIWYPPGKDSLPTKVPLPDGNDTWAAGRAPDTTVLWVQQRSGFRSYDFSDPAVVKEEAVEPDKVPTPIREALPAVIGTPLAPAAPKPAAAPAATQANDNAGQQSPSVDLNPVAPKHEYARSLFRKWQANARTDGKIPGALMGHVAKTLDDFVKQYPDNEATPKLAAIRPKFDASHDWNQIDVVALLDEVTAISTAPVSWAESPMESSEMWTVQRGEPLPIELKSAAWGEPAANGLRAAWLLKPRAEQYPLGSVLKARVLFHNTGTKPIIFKTETWHQNDRHTARNASGVAINVGSTWYTGRTPMATYRLEPGEYVEVTGHGIAIGAGEYVGERSIGSVGAWIEAKAGDKVWFSSSVDASRGGWTGVDDPKDPNELWKLVVRRRIEREAPLPTLDADREQLIRQVTLQLFGGNQQLTRSAHSLPMMRPTLWKS